MMLAVQAHLFDTLRHCLLLHGEYMHQHQVYDSHAFQQQCLTFSSLHITYCQLIRSIKTHIIKHLCTYFCYYQDCLLSDSKCHCPVCRNFLHADNYNYSRASCYISNYYDSNNYYTSPLSSRRSRCLVSPRLK